MIVPITGFDIEAQPGDVLIRMCLWGEARGEPYDGQLAIAHVIKNRAAAKGVSVKEIILAPWQFSSFNKNDPNRVKLLKAHETSPYAWGIADCICTLLEHKMTKDPTDGATHYYAYNIVDPAWGRKHPGWKEKVVISRHVFGIAA